MYPRHRLDALADGIYGVAMTLLVLDIRIPDGMVNPTDQQLTDAFVALLPKLGPYALSFWVLSGRWRQLIYRRTSHEPVGPRYVQWSLMHLFLVTMMPFSTLMIGRFGSHAPALWLYTANLVGLSATLWMASRSATEAERAEVEDNKMGLIMLLIASAVVVALSFQHTAWAALGFLFTGLTPAAERLFARGKTPPSADA
jgi:uncharacterized membrane protein